MEFIDRSPKKHPETATVNRFICLEKSSGLPRGKNIMIHNLIFS